MRIGILVSSIGNFGQKGFYNAQEIGLAKALDVLFDEVKVYKLVTRDWQEKCETIDGCKNATITFLPGRNFGINGIVDPSKLDASLDALVYFSDTQFSVPTVFRWARKHNIRFLPLIGVLESHSTSRLKRMIVDGIFWRNVRVYKQCSCLAKTPAVASQLQNLGVGDVTVVPVGLDLSLLKEDFAEAVPSELKKKYGFSENDKVLLFVGRLIDEKQPVRMIDIFAKIAEMDNDFRLLMVGTGELREAVEDAIRANKLEEKVCLVDKIPNSEIWELYRLAHCFVNLNQQEIFGMAILEAMYYGCKVVAWTAPGPDYILENGVSGWLVSDDDQAVEKILDTTDFTGAANKRILEAFTWETAARRIFERL